MCRQRTHEQMLCVLKAAQEFRPQKDHWVDKELEWVTYEREAMLDAVNLIRQQRGCPDATEEEIQRAENCAAGHSDYSSKFALYAAELALA